MYPCRVFDVSVRTRMTTIVASALRAHVSVRSKNGTPGGWHRRRAASGLSFSNRRREPRACLVSERTSPNSSGFCMYVFSNVTLSPTGMTGSSSPIALALFPFGVSRGRRACRDGDGRGRSGGPRSAARGEPRSAGRARRGTRRRARRSAGAEGESTEASKSPRNLCEKTRIRGLINRGPLIRFGGPHSQTTGAPCRE